MKKLFIYLKNYKKECVLGPAFKLLEALFELFVPLATVKAVWGKEDFASGDTIKANFYKCGDDMPQKHYLSWHPIRIEKPNFHRPDHFGTLIFE